MKRGGGGAGWGVSRTKSLRLCCAAELSEGTSFHTGSAVLVQTDTACSILHSRFAETDWMELFQTIAERESFTFHVMGNLSVHCLFCDRQPNNMVTIRLKMILSLKGKYINQKVIITRLLSTPQDVKERMDSGEQKQFWKYFIVI